MLHGTIVITEQWGSDDGEGSGDSSQSSQNAVVIGGGRGATLSPKPIKASYTTKGPNDPGRNGMVPLKGWEQSRGPRFSPLVCRE